MGPAECRARVDAGWRTEYVKESSILSPENDLEGHVLGINFDDADGISNQFREASSLACAARKQVKIIDDIPCELAVMQACLGVCKVNHLLRAAGLYVGRSALHEQLTRPIS